MTTIKEAREIVRALVDDPHTAVDDVMIAVDAYGAARELKGHVEACQTRDCTPGYGAPSHACGDGWLCDDAREIEELSGGAASA